MITGGEHNFERVLVDVRANAQKTDKERIAELELAVAMLKSRLFTLENKGVSD